MMTLTDVYCLYNRARGTSLISPDDLLEACGLFVRLGVGMHVRDFPTCVATLLLMPLWCMDADGREGGRRMREQKTWKGCVLSPSLADTHACDVRVVLQGCQGSAARLAPR
jgi:hypothetical protein